jgi:DNA-directed RNA polymerase subunit omega
VARISSEKAVEMIGNRFELVLAASQRTRELKNGSLQRVDGKDASPTITALREIEEGKFTRKDWLDKIPKRKKGQRDADFT